MEKSLKFLKEQEKACNDYMRAFTEQDLIDYEDDDELEAVKKCLIEVKEAIVELEEAMKPMTCEGCVYFRDDRQCWIENINNYLTCKRHTFELPMVDRYEPKANA